MNETDADRRLAANRSDPEALAAKGDAFLARMDRRSAGAWYGAALKAIRADDRSAATLREKLLKTLASFEREQADHLVSSLREVGHSRSDWHPRFGSAIAMMQRRQQRPAETFTYPSMPMTFYYPGLPHREFIPADEFEWAGAIEAELSTIQKEASELLEQKGHFGPYVRTEAARPQGDVHGMLGNTDWSTFEFTERGEPIAEAVDLAPNTYKSIDSTAPLCRISGRSPSIMFSLLKAGRRIPPHTGMINARYICHLPLIVPGNGRLRVGTSKKEWVEGKLLVFDDTIEHDAINNADQDRVVLIFDIWRPELENIEREQLNALFVAVDSF